MKNTIKVILTLTLSFLLLSSLIHIDLHNHDYTDEYSICATNCDDEGHHFSYHTCGECIVIETQILKKECFELTFPNHKQLYVSYQYNFKKTVDNFDLYSRPPPQFI